MSHAARLPHEAKEPAGAEGILRFMRVSCAVVCSAAALLFLDSCGGIQSTSPLPAGGAAATRQRSWIEPGAKNQDLLYMTDWRDGVVVIVSYPEGKKVGAITGFHEPEGECVDASGNVFVADRLHHEVQEFTHGGTEPIAILKYPGADPYGCAIDPITGNLAVTNGSRSRKQQSVIAIYIHATGVPETYAFAGFNALYCGYDDRGNLYVDGVHAAHHQFELEELSAGGTELVPVSLDQTIAYPGSVQWDGKYMVIADSFPPVAYRFAFTSSGGTMAGKTTFGKLYEVSQLWIQGSRILGADGSVQLWKYPEGGKPLKSFGGAYAVAGVVSPVQP